VHTLDFEFEVEFEFEFEVEVLFIEHLPRSLTSDFFFGMPILYSS